MIKSYPFKAVIMILGLFTAVSACGNPAGPASGPPQEKIINHLNWDPSGLPDSLISGGAALDSYFQHASVGSNICDGLDALAAEAGSRYTMDRTADAHSNPAWFDTHSGLSDHARGNPGAQAKVEGFLEALQGPSLASKLDVATFKFCYIDNPWKAQELFDLTKSAMETLEAAHPSVIFLWWTMPIETQANAERQEFNDLVRDYCRAEGKWLFDIAALESHDDDGTLRKDSDSRELLVEAYTSDGGHLNSLGSRKVALAWWRFLGEAAKNR